ncbi:unnamed protein product, partial [Meganyctiphanes norvegica]
LTTTMESCKHYFDGEDLSTFHQHNSTGMHGHLPEEIVTILKVRKIVVLPILVVLVLASNIFCFIVTRSSKLREMNINRYLQCLIVADICTAILYIPQLFFTDTCWFERRIPAFFKAHLRSSSLYYTKYCTTFILANLTFDRFCGIWFEKVYQQIKQNSRRRLFILWLWITASALPVIFLGEVCLDSKNGLWRGISGFRNTENPLVPPYKDYILYSMGILPSSFLIILSIGIVIGIARQKIPNSKNRNLRNTIAVLVLNFLYIACILTYGVVLYKRPSKDKDCYSDMHREITLGVCESLTIVWSIINTLIFFVICKTYNAEAKTVLLRIGSSPHHIKIILIIIFGSFITAICIAATKPI